MYNLNRLITLQNQQEDAAQENNDENFLAEIIETSSTVSLAESRPQRLVEWPEFMSMRCEVAKSGLKEKLRNEAKLGIYGFVPSLPLFSFDLDRRAILRRPNISEVKSPHFQDFVGYVHELGFSCFIDRPGLTSWCDRGSKQASSPELDLKDFGLYDFQYFDEIGAPKARRQGPGKVRWALYVLLPGHKIPEFSSKRYFKYNHNPVPAVPIWLKLTALLPIALIPLLIIFSPMLLDPYRPYDPGNASRAVLNGNGVPEKVEKGE